MLRDELRRQTRSRHERIEAALDLPGSVRDAHDYRRLLGALFGFYVPIEAALGFHEAPLRRVGLDVSARRKADSLRADLRLLNLTHQAIDALATCPAIPALTTWRHALGALYVLEGSTLGGQLITRRLGRIQPDLPTSFFRGYGDRTGAMWRAFVAVINGTALTAGEQAQVLHGAEQTFDTLERWMTKAL